MNFKILLLFSFLLISSSCFNAAEEKTDQALLEKDRKTLENSMDSYKVLVYKFGKIALRSSTQKEGLSAEHQEFQEKLTRVSSKLQKQNPDGTLNLSTMEYLSLFKDYRSMKTYVEKTDEDIFPTLFQGLSTDFGKDTSEKMTVLTPEEKVHEQNMEHAILSGVVLLSRDFGKKISLYECSKTNPELMKGNEGKALMQYYRGFLFFDKGLYYLSESEISENIRWLNANPTADLTYTKEAFGWTGATDRHSYVGFLSMNHLFRGFDRLMMNREIDEQRALEDFEAFLKGTNEIGMSNEATWGIETYLYIKKEEPEKAIAALNKLKTSDLLSDKEKKSIDQTIGYLKDRETGKVLNGVYDKYFLSKVITKYMFAVLTDVDWKKILKEQDVPYTDEAFKTIDAFKSFLENMEQYTSGEQLKEVGKDLKETGSGLFDKAKELINK